MLDPRSGLETKICSLGTSRTDSSMARRQSFCSKCSLVIVLPHILICVNQVADFARLSACRVGGLLCAGSSKLDHFRLFFRTCLWLVAVGPGSNLMEATDALLIKEEADQIRKQFRSLSLRPGCQVMWSGVPREWAQL